MRSQGALCSIQLAHAGRKASTVAPWIGTQYRRENNLGPGSIRADADVGGWPDDVVGPMGGESEIWDGVGLGQEGGFFPPKQLTEADCQQLVKDWGDAADRAIKAGVDLIEIHAAHGYLLHQFLSLVTNRRTDKYGGSFEGRTRLAKEIIRGVRSRIPENMPLLFRISSTDWLEGSNIEKECCGSWDVESSVRLALELPELGVDLLDVSSGGNHKDQNTSQFLVKDYQVSRAGKIRREVRKQGNNLLIGAVGLITEAESAMHLVQEGSSGLSTPNGTRPPANIEAEAAAVKAITDDTAGTEPMADVILVARQFLREPERVLKVAWQLGVDVAWRSQCRRVRFS